MKSCPFRTPGKFYMSVFASDREKQAKRSHPDDGGLNVKTISCKTYHGEIYKRGRSPTCLLPTKFYNK